MPKKTLRIPFKYSSPCFCLYCKTEVKRKDIVAGRAKEVEEGRCICPDCLLHPKIEDAKTEKQPDVQSESRPPVVKKGKPKNIPVAENEAFIYMILAAQDDKTMRDRILALARLDSFHRKSLINSLITDMRMQGKKGILLASAIECLKDDDIALKTIEILIKK